MAGRWIREALVFKLTPKAVFAIPEKRSLSPIGRSGRTQAAHAGLRTTPLPGGFLDARFNRFQ